MRKFWLVLVIAFVLGGFIGAEVTGSSFSILGATVALVLTASVLLGLGAYFHHQEEKKTKDIPPEVRRIFAGMSSAMQETDALITRAKQQPQKDPPAQDRVSAGVSSLNQFIQVAERWPEEERIAAIQLMTNIIDGKTGDKELSRSLLSKMSLRNRATFMLYAKQIKGHM